MTFPYNKLKVPVNSPTWAKIPSQSYKTFKISFVGWKDGPKQMKHFLLITNMSRYTAECWECQEIRVKIHYTFTMCVALLVQVKAAVRLPIDKSSETWEPYDNKSDVTAVALWRTELPLAQKMAQKT